MNKIEMQDLLKGNIYNVTFTKINGVQRIMRCTLMQSLLPAPAPDTTKARKACDDVVACFDLDADGWRSFRLDAVIGYEISQ